METLTLVALSVLAVASALIVVLHRNPVRSAIALAFNLISIAGFYLLLHGQFIALVQVIVYAGAILVLILFVIMLLNLREEQLPHPSGTFQRPLALLLCAAFVAAVGRAIWAGAPKAFPEADPGFGNVAFVGRALFSTFWYPFEVVSLLLVVAMVGAVLLAKRRL